MDSISCLLKCVPAVIKYVMDQMFNSVLVFSCSFSICTSCNTCKVWYASMSIVLQMHTSFILRKFLTFKYKKICNAPDACVYTQISFLESTNTLPQVIFESQFIIFLLRFIMSFFKGSKIILTCVCVLIKLFVNLIRSEQWLWTNRI